jgi:hypothetical protein
MEKKKADVSISNRIACGHHPRYMEHRNSAPRPSCWACLGS